VGVVSYVVVVRFCELELLAEGFGGASAQLIEDVVVAFLGALRADARFFQQVVRNEAAHHLVLRVKMNLNKLAEATAVIVASRLCVSKSFQYRIS